MKKICCFAIVAVIVMTTVRAQATIYTWTKNATGSHDWADVANWETNGVFASGPTNELRFDPPQMPVNAFATLTNIPAALSMNALTLDGVGPDGAGATAGTDFVIGDNTSAWTIGDGTNATINLIATRGGGSNDRIIRWDVAPNMTLNQALTAFTGNGTFYERTFMFTGDIAESGAGYGITKSGTSWLGFYGSNTYSGETTVNGGVLRLGSVFALPGGIGVSGGTSALTISDGMLELGSNDFQRGPGTGSDQFQIPGGSSGFGAAGAPRSVMVNNDAAQELVWGSTHFAPTVLALNRGDSSDNDLTLLNKMDLNGATRTVDVGGYTAIISGDIQTSSGTAGLTKTGVGTLVLSGANSYNGTTTISGGTLSVSAADNLGAGSAGLIMNGGGLQITGTALASISSLGHAVTFNNNAKAFDIQDAFHTFTVDQVLSGTTLTKSGAGTLVLNQNNTFTGTTTSSGGGTLVLDYSTNDGSKLADAQTLALEGATLELRGGTHSEAVSAMTMSASLGNFITRSTGAATLNLNTITRGGARRGSLSFSTNSIATTDNLNSSIGTLGGWVTVGSHLAVNSTDGADGPITAYSNYTPFVTSGGTLNTNYQLIGSSNLTGGASMGTLRIESDADDQVLDLQNYSLLIDNYNKDNYGVMLYAGGANNNYTITGGGTIVCRNSSGQALGFNIYTGTLTLDVPLGVGGSDFVKTGAGTLVMNQPRTQHTGATYLQQGVTRLTHGDALGSSSITLQGGAALELTNNITLGATALTITGTGPAGGGALRSISGNNTFSGGITVTESAARISSDSGTLTLAGDISAIAKIMTFGGAGNITVSNATVNALGITKDGAGTLGIVVDDSSNTQWNCSRMTLNASTLAFTFNVAPSETQPVVKVVGDLTFSGTPTFEIVIDDADFSSGMRYPLFEVAGDAPAKPTLVAPAGALKWGGDGNRTLYWDTSPSGTVLIVR